VDGHPALVHPIETSLLLSSKLARLGRVVKGHAAWRPSATRAAVSGTYTAATVLNDRISQTPGVLPPCARGATGAHSDPFGGSSGRIQHDVHPVAPGFPIAHTQAVRTGTLRPQDPDANAKIEIDVAIEMRDAIKLSCDIFRPDDHDSHPALLYVYYRDRRTRDGLALIVQPLDAVERGYALITADCRGTFRPEGILQLFAARAADGYNLVEWIARQSWRDGNVGASWASGMSVTAFQTAIAAAATPESDLPHDDRRELPEPMGLYQRRVRALAAELGDDPNQQPACPHRPDAPPRARPVRARTGLAVALQGFGAEGQHRSCERSLVAAALVVPWF
jgi:X-Pro dipeptidyl-peptidase (S15 family)